MATVIARKNEKTGLVVNPSTGNAEYGYVRLTQTRVSVNAQGFIESKEMSCLLKGKLADLEALGFADGKPSPIQGTIIVEESTTPFYEGMSPKINPQTGEILMHNGSPIYRQTRLDVTSNAKDTLLAHDKDINSVSVAANADESAEA